MKKIYISTAAIFAAAAALVTQSFAATPSITVKSDKSDIVYTYTSSDGSTEALADASKLFDGFNDAAEEYTSAVLTITSESDDSDNVEVALRLSTDKTDLEYSVLDYYDFRITDENDKIIYDSDNTDPTAPDIAVKDISFGIFNTESGSETKKFLVEYKIDEMSSANIDEETLEALKVSFVSQIMNSDNAEADYSVTITSEIPEIPQVVEAASDSAPSDDASEGGEGNSEAKVIDYKAICGTDLSAGRYTVTGKGTLKIEGADGTEKSTTVIKDDTVPDIEGVKKAIVTITDGDVITALPLEGDEKPSIRFEKLDLAADTATAAPTAEPARETSTPEPRKSNPRTGDENSTAGVLAGIMFTAGVAICVLEVIKRKKTQG